MKNKEKRIRILDLQDQYCQTCEYRMKLLKECVQHCAIGQELKMLASGLFRKHKEQKSREEWDEICGQAAKLYEQGFGTIMITKVLSCPSSTLREQLKKRGLWKGKTQVEIQEQSQKKWNDWCQQALKLREQGMNYPKIAQHLGIPASNLRDQMRKRGFHS